MAVGRQQHVVPHAAPGLLIGALQSCMCVAGQLMMIMMMAARE